MSEPLPLATIHDAVLEFLKGRADAVVFGATAVNAYVAESRMTQDIDVMSTRAAELAEELRQYLSDRFHIAARVREVNKGKGYRVFQIQKTGNRHLVDLRSVETLPSARRIEEVMVLAPAELVARKILSYSSRRGQPKAFSDMRDLTMLLLAFPEYKQNSGPVSDALTALGASDQDMASWRDLVAQEIIEPNEDSKFD